MAKIFISYNAKDHGWTDWIGFILSRNGHELFVSGWEVKAGQNIPQWMNEKLQLADNLLGVFSDAYTQAIYSGAERDAAFWIDPSGSEGFLIPVEVEKVSEWPPFVKPLRRLSLVGLNEAEAETKLLDFLKPPSPPSERPNYPGKTPGRPKSKFEGTSSLDVDAFVYRTEPLPPIRPVFPISAGIPTAETHIVESRSDTSSPSRLRVDLENSPVVTVSGRITTHHEVPKGSELRAAKGFFLELDRPLSVDDGVGGCDDYDKVVVLESGAQLPQWVNRQVTIEGKLGRFVSAREDPSIFIEVATIKSGVD